MAELLSQAAYARRRGVSRQAVNKAIQEGRISVAAGRKIDPEVADAQWTSTADPARGANAPLQVKTTTSPPTSRGRDLEENGTAAKTYQDARALRELYQMRLTRLELGQKEGELVPLAEVTTAAYDAARRARDLLLQMADRLAPEVAPVTQVPACHALIMREVTRACEELSCGKRPE